MYKLLFTGASGFLGDNLKPILLLENDITTLGLGNENDINCNLARNIPNLGNRKFDVVLHAAGKAHSIPRTEAEIKSFFDINYQGTINLCKALETHGIPKSFVFISTVAVYGADFGDNITEDHPLNGTTPYALSKIQAEHFLIEWCKQHNVILSIIRPSLIVGPNPPGNLGDMIRGIKIGRYVSIAKGKARKSMLMVQDVAYLLPLLAERGGVFNVCDDNHPSFRELEILISSQLNKKMPFSMPLSFLKLMAFIGDFIGKKSPINSLRLKKMTQSLTFSNEKVKRELCWVPMDVIKNFRIK